MVFTASKVYFSKTSEKDVIVDHIPVGVKVKSIKRRLPIFRIEPNIKNCCMCHENERVGMWIAPILGDTHVMLSFGCPQLHDIEDIQLLRQDESKRVS